VLLLVLLVVPPLVSLGFMFDAHFAIWSVEDKSRDVIISVDGYVVKIAGHLVRAWSFFFD
jgi:hypothetical protein